MGKKSKTVTAKTVYGNTTTSNPYVTSKTDNNGTTSSFKEGTAIYDINDFVNKNMNKLLDTYLNPTLESVTNQAKMKSFINNLNSASSQALENNIINPLSRRNMVRSSQATNMYNNLLQNNVNQAANYANELLAGSQKETASVLANLMLLYMNGYNILNDTQQQSLATSQGNSTKTNTATSSGSSGLFDASQMMQLITQMALKSAGL